MNKSLLLASRILVTMLVAAIAGTAITVAVVFILANIGVSNETSLTTGTAVFYTILGVATGYRLNDLIKEYRKH